MENDNIKFKIIKTLILFSLLFLTFLIPFLSMQNFSPAYDEITHLPSGFSYLKTGELKLNPEHPPLIKMLAATPLLFLNLKFDFNDPNLAGSKTDEWQFGRDLLFNNGTDRVIFWGRIPVMLLSVLLAFLSTPLCPISLPTRNLSRWTWVLPLFLSSPCIICGSLSSPCRGCLLLRRNPK